MKKVLVCGATGFIGRNAVEHLAKRDDLEVHAVSFNRPEYDVPGVTWHRADLRAVDAVNELVAGMDVIVQAAATTSGAKDIVSRPYIHVTDNAVMNSLLLRAAYDHKVGQFVFFSCTVMLPSREEPWDEDGFDGEIHPRYFGVGWTKVYVERMCEFFSRLGVTRYTVFRHSNMYGPHDKFDLERSHVFGATITKAMTAEDGRIVVWGTGEEARDLLYVDDLVDAVERAIDRQREPFKLYNIGAGHAVSIKDLVHKIVAASGRALRIEHDLSQPTIRTSLSVDCGKARDELGWQPRVGLDDGIARTIAWWRANLAKP
ncbi:MAG TPA: NAD-dependent epimerase/dehydratase family protein [Candidatus Sulfotelmatobacter sp.]|nr:NAD-dependent epimerase/dehydratase family protein [Candidatus Sulfotelmatobacter sp.]